MEAMSNIQGKVTCLPEPQWCLFALLALEKIYKMIR